MFPLLHAMMDDGDKSQFRQLFDNNNFMKPDIR